MLKANGTIRAFIAIEVPEAIRRELLAIQNAFKPLLSRGRISWVSWSNLHLTLRFFGTGTRDQISEIIRACEFISSSAVFDVHLDRIGFFPDERKPRVFWCGYAASEKLKQLQERIETVSTESGFIKEEREFHPHVTLARLKEIRMTEADAKKMSEQAKGCRFSFVHSVESVTLFQSHLSSEGSEYEVLKKFRLTNN